jgi:hypothetical protein
LQQAVRHPAPSTLESNPQRPTSAGLDAGVVAYRLRAVAAVFLAAAGLDRQQRRQLHLVGVEVLAVDLLGAEDQVVEGQLEQRSHIVQGPAGVGSGRHGAPPARA